MSPHWPNRRSCPHHHHRYLWGTLEREAPQLLIIEDFAALSEATLVAVETRRESSDHDRHWMRKMTAVKLVVGLRRGEAGAIPLLLR
jgi:hypothetical protein